MPLMRCVTVVTCVFGVDDSLEEEVVDVGEALQGDGGVAEDGVLSIPERRQRQT